MKIRDKFTSDKNDITKEYTTELDIFKLEQTETLTNILNALRIALLK